MTVLPGCALPLLLTLGAPPGVDTSVALPRPRPGGSLGAEDARYLDYLVEDFLFDPKGAARVRVRVPSPLARLYGQPGADGTETRDGWLVKGARGEPDRVYFTDGESIPAPAKVQNVDFEADCARRYRPGRPADNPLAALVRESDAAEEADLTVAAWLHRRGYDGLAARALAAARDEPGPDPRQVLRVRLARRAYDRLVAAFLDRADAEALAHGERLLRLYPDVAKEQRPQAADIVADLKRRQKAGTFGKVPTKDWPAGFADWPARRRAAFLIDALDEVQGEAEPIFGERVLTEDRRYKALVALGDAAVPALIDALERDGRLTRCPRQTVRTGCLAGDPSGPRLLTARDVARRAVWEIIRVRVLEPTTDEEENEDSLPAGLRRYWARYGRLPFGERMMAVLTDPAARPIARREAAAHLVQVLRQPRQSWSRDTRRRDVPWTDWPHPALTRFRDPTVGEALLAALDQEQRADASEANGGRGRHGDAAGFYADLLGDLGDPRVVPELARRADEAAVLEDRLAFAVAADRLGAPGPLLRLAREVEAGTIRLAAAEESEPNPDAATDALGGVVSLLAWRRRPETDRALYALADPTHPLHPLAAEAVLTNRARRFDHPWRQHPYCLAVLRARLTDTRPAGVHYYLRGDEIERLTPEPVVLGGRRPRVADPGEWAEHVEARACDLAAMELAHLVVGAPEFHPLRRDADRVRAALADLVDRHGRAFREPDAGELSRWDMYGPRAAYVPDIRPLGRPATADDVKAGRAVFHLNGRGKAIDAKPSTWLVLKAGSNGPGHPESAETARRGLVVQAEVGPDGRVVYGVIFRHAVRAVRADEAERVEPAEKR